MRAERGLQFGRDQTTLPGVLGVHVVDFTWFLPNRETSRPRLERTFWVITRQRGRLARVAGHIPQPPGSRVASVFTLRTPQTYRKPSVYKTPPIRQLKPTNSTRVHHVRLTAHWHCPAPSLASPFGQAGPPTVLRLASRTALSPPSAPPRHNKRRPSLLGRDNSSC